MIKLRSYELFRSRLFSSITADPSEGAGMFLKDDIFSLALCTPWRVWGQTP